MDPPDVLVQGVRVHEQQAALVTRQLLGGLGDDSIDILKFRLQISMQIRVQGRVATRSDPAPGFG